MYCGKVSQSQVMPASSTSNGMASTFTRSRIAQEAEEIEVLELERDADVRRRGDREDQMAHGHDRGGPEGDDEPEHDRMTHQPVKTASRERRMRVHRALHVEEHLAQAEGI